MSHDGFDRLVQRSDPAMVIVTASNGVERSGCLVGFHSQCSIEPPRYAIWISRANHTFTVVETAEHLGVHFLTAADRQLAELFGTASGDDVDKFAGLHVDETMLGVPVLTACAERMVVRRVGWIDDGEGDHVGVVTEPVEAAAGGATAGPLRLSDVDDLSAGHDADEAS